MILQFMGAGSETDAGGNVMDGVDSQHADPDIGFKFLSSHGLAAFLMMFGLIGLALYRQNQAGVIISLSGAVAAGLGAVWVIGKMFEMAYAMQSSGTLKTADAVGCSGTVYIAIPKGGKGRVTINFRERLREFDAIDKNQEAIQSGTPIRVVNVNANLLIVEKIDKL
jgi:membrane protein implicated in regulation of membrane protease activity